MSDIIMGAETEYAFTPFGAGGSALDRTDYSRRLVSLGGSNYPALYGQNAHDLYLSCGSRLYVDSGLGLLNVEISTAECSTPEELVAHVKAGDRLLAELARELERVDPVLKKAFISKTSQDYSQHTAGSHENYSHTAPQALLGSQLVPHLVTRLIYSGGGGFSDAQGSSSKGIEFMLSPRVRFLEFVSAAGSQDGRAIFCTRQEALSCSSYGRLHLLCGDGVRYDLTEYLRFGCTALVVKLIDSGFSPADGIELDPISAMNVVARDIGCEEIIGSINGAPATAIDIQRHYLSAVQDQSGGPHLPDWAGVLVQRWRTTLDALETDPMALYGVIDWPTKLAFYRSFAEHGGFDWDRLTRKCRKSERDLRSKLFELDIRFGDISEESPFASLPEAAQAESRLVSERQIETALRVPPQGTRAKLRGERIEQLATRRAQYRANWDAIHDVRAGRSMRFDDPFGSAAVGWLPRG